MGKWEKNEVGLLGMTERAFRIHQLQLENSSSCVMIIKVRIKFRTRGTFRDGINPNVCVGHEDRTANVQLYAEEKNVGVGFF